MIASIAVLALGASSGVAKRPKTERLVVHIDVQIFRLPTPSRSGLDIGFDSFPAPFGHGLQYDVFKFMPKTATTGSALLKFKAYFDTGTVSGVWHATYRFVGPMKGFFKQKITWSGGTGAFRHIHGSGTGTGVEIAMHGKITQSITVSGL